MEMCISIYIYICMNIYIERYGNIGSHTGNLMLAPQHQVRLQVSSWDWECYHAFLATEEDRPHVLNLLCRAY